MTKTQILQLEHCTELEQKLDLTKSKILNSYNNQDSSTQRATSLLLKLVRELYSNPNQAQLDSEQQYDLYELQELLNDFELMRQTEQKLASLKQQLKK